MPLINLDFIACYQTESASQELLYSSRFNTTFNMEDLIKKLVSNGINLMTATVEKVQETIDDLVEKGKVSREEGKKIVDDFLKKSEAKRQDFDSKFKEKFGSVFDNMPKTFRQEIQDIKARLDAIEAKLGMNQDEESE